MQQQLPIVDSLRLFDDVIALEQLRIGFKHVKQNKGSAGVDNQSIAEFERNLEQELSQLHNELRQWRYQPKPVKRIEILKPDGAGVRILGIPTVRDRVVQASIKNVLEPLIDPTFSNFSYGFRPERNQHRALLMAQQIVCDGKPWVVDIDLSKFFDRINHDKVIQRLRSFTSDTRLLRLIGMTLRSGALDKTSFIPTVVGSVQGSPLSPLLSNLILDELDKELEKRGLSFCRFADDCNIFVRSELAAKRVLSSITTFIETKLKLVINTEKTKVARSRKVKFLGMTITSGALAISKHAMRKAMTKVKQLTPRGTQISIETKIEQVNLWYRGWSNYFCLTQYPQQLAGIESHMRRRLRSMLIRQHHRPRFLYRKFTDRGVPGSHAKVAFLHKRTWRLSRSQAAHLAWSNEWFINTMGLHSAIQHRQPYWFGFNRQPYL